MRISKTLISTVASAALLLILAAPQAMALLPNNYTCTGHANGASVTGTAHTDITNPSTPGGGAGSNGDNCVSNAGTETLSSLNKQANSFVGIVDKSGSRPGACKYTTDFLSAAGYNEGPDGTEGGEGFWYYTQGPWQGCVMGVQFSAYGKTGTFSGFLYTHSSPLFNPPAAFVAELLKNKIIPAARKGHPLPTCSAGTTAGTNVGDLGCYGGPGAKPPVLPF